MTRIITSLVLIMMLAACNLTNSSTPPEIVIDVTDLATHTATATTALLTTNTPLPTNTATTAPSNTNTCNTPNGWTTYTVQAGDTLFSIAQRAASSVNELVDANCLESANNLNVGQVIYVPQSVSAPSTGEKIVYWLASDTAVNSESLLIGCETYITPIETSVDATDDPASNIRIALNAMFNTTPNAPYRNHWDEFGLSVDTVSISGDQASIRIDGDFLLIGTCGDPEIVAQILLTIFEEPSLQSAFIDINDANFRQWSDMSGRAGPNDVFTRDSIPLRDS